MSEVHSRIGDLDFLEACGAAEEDALNQPPEVGQNVTFLDLRSTQNDSLYTLYVGIQAIVFSTLEFRVED